MTNDYPRCADCGAIKSPDDERDWGYGFDFTNDRRWYVCPDCATGARQN